MVVKEADIRRRSRRGTQSFRVRVVVDDKDLSDWFDQVAENMPPDLSRYVRRVGPFTFQVKRTA